jgi:hypothetical protein
MFRTLKAAGLDNSVEAEMRAALARIEVLIIDLSRPRRYPDMSLGWMRLFLSRRVFWLGGGRRGRHNSAAGRDPFPSEHGASVEGGHDGTGCLDAR